GSRHLDSLSPSPSRPHGEKGPGSGSLLARLRGFSPRANRVASDDSSKPLGVDSFPAVSTALPTPEAHDQGDLDAAIPGSPSIRTRRTAAGNADGGGRSRCLGTGAGDGADQEGIFGNTAGHGTGGHGRGGSTVRARGAGGSAAGGGGGGEGGGMHLAPLEKSPSRGRMATGGSSNGEADGSSGGGSGGVVTKGGAFRRGRRRSRSNNGEERQRSTSRDGATEPLPDGCAGSSPAGGAAWGASGGASGGDNGDDSGERKAPMKQTPSEEPPEQKRRRSVLDKVLPHR
ncbi:unnamed protein product, partial [Phaeothamnion confervicola]